MTAKWVQELPFWDDEKSLELDTGHLCTFANVLNAIKLYTLIIDFILFVFWHNKNNVLQKNKGLNLLLSMTEQLK